MGGTSTKAGTPGRVRLSRTVLAVGLALVLAIAGTTAVIILYLRGEALEDARHRVATLAAVLATQTDRQFHTTDFVLLATIDRLRVLDRVQPAPQLAAADHELQAFVAVQVAANPQIRALRVAGPDGRVRYASDGDMGGAVSLAVSRSFSVHRAAPGPGGGLHIDSPLASVAAPGSGGPPRSFVVSRRIDGAGGAFAGIVAAEMETRHFLEMFRAADLAPAGAIALVRRDGIVLTVEPYRDDKAGRTLPGDDGFGVPLFADAALAGGPAVAAWKPLAGYPVVLSVALAEDAALAGWRQQALLFGGGGAAAAALSLLMAALLAARFAREEKLTAALAAGEQRFRDIAEASSDWIWEMGPDLRFTYFSDRLYEMTGSQPAYALGKTREEIADPVELARPDWQAHLDDLRNHRAFRGFTYAHRRADGTLRRFRISGTPVYDADGRFQGYRGTGTDVTAEHEAEARARLAQERLRDAVEFMPEGFVLYDADDRLVLCNSSYRRLHGRTPAAITPGTRYEDILRAAHASGELHPEDDVEATIAARIRRHRNPEGPFELVSQGRVIRIAEQRTGDGGVVGIHADITDLKQREAALIDAKQSADAANRAKSEFLANMSHELRTPLNAIIGFAETIERGLFGPAPDKYVEYSRDIRSSGEHLLAVISDILDMSKIESGKYEFQEEVISLPDIVAGCVLMVRHQAEARGVSVEVPPPVPDLWLHADRRAVTQVTINLLSNAVKFTDRGGSVTVGFSIGRDAVALSVRDTGVGIPPEILPRLFEPFSRGSAATSRRADGTGLGLAISKKLMERHGGRIDIRSKVGEGTTAICVFPASRRIDMGTAAAV